MNWKDEILKSHKGQSGFFKEIEKEQNTMKTREEIIDTLKKKTIKAYFDLQEYEAMQGEDAPSTRFFRNRWGTLHLLLEEIGEPLDYKNLKK